MTTPPAVPEPGYYWARIADKMYTNFPRPYPTQAEIAEIPWSVVKVSECDGGRKVWYPGCEEEMVVAEWGPRLEPPGLCVPDLTAAIMSASSAEISVSEPTLPVVPRPMTVETIDLDEQRADRVRGAGTMTVRSLIARLQQLVTEQPAIADMPVELDDCGRCGCGGCSNLCTIAIGPAAIVLGERVTEWVQCACGHEVADHRAPGAECVREGCSCTGYAAPLKSPPRRCPRTLAACCTG